MTKKEHIHTLSKGIYDIISSIYDEADFYMDCTTSYIHSGVKVTKTDENLNGREDIGSSIYYFRGRKTNYIIEDTSSHSDYKIILNRFILESILEKLQKERE